MKSCMTCGSNENLRSPLKGWVKTGMLPETICSKCLSDWSEGKTLVEIEEKEVLPAEKGGEG